MSVFDTIVLGIVQGLTEFLPISSSGHLVIGQALLGFNKPGLVLEVVLHLGTLVAILMYFRDKIKQNIVDIFQKDMESIQLLIHIIIATIPAGVIGILFKDKFDSLFTVQTVGFTLLTTGLVLLFTKNIGQKSKAITWRIALLVGIAQACAILPGISRSGITIATALFLGVTREESAEFSFLLAIPALLGAGILSIGDIVGMTNQNTMALFFGFIASVVSGYMVIGWLMSLISQRRFWIFSLYCIPLGLTIIWLN